MKRGVKFYKELLTKRALLLERHSSYPGGAAGARASAQQVRLAIERDVPLAVLKVVSDAVGQTLKLCDLRRFAEHQKISHRRGTQFLHDLRAVAEGKQPGARKARKLLHDLHATAERKHRSRSV